jgi:hypothetical protein
VYLTFDLSIAPMLFYRSSHCFIITPEPCDEAFQFRNLRGYASCQPGFQGIRVSILEDLAELLRQVLGRRDVRMTDNCLDPALFVWCALHRRLG